VMKTENKVIVRHEPLFPRIFLHSLTGFRGG